MQSLRLKYAMIKLKPGFHMIATIAVIAAIAEKKKKTLAIAAIIAIIVAAIAGEWFHSIAEI